MKEHVWKTTILEEKISVEDKDLIVSECLSSDYGNGEGHNLPFLNGDDHPVSSRFRDDVIGPAMKRYAEVYLGADVASYSLQSFFRLTTGNSYTPPHIHKGALVSAVLYLDESYSRFIAFDPRHNAARGYPDDVKDGYFGEKKITPMEGTLLIFPSYLLHMAEPGPKHLRPLLVTDMFF